MEDPCIQLQNKSFDPSYEKLSLQIMTNEEAKLFLKCNQKDSDCYQNEVFKFKQKLLSSYQHHLLLKKASDQALNQSKAAAVLGFNEQNLIVNSLDKGIRIQTIGDLISSYRNFDQKLSRIKLKISQANQFIQIKESIDQWISLINQRTSAIYEDIISSANDFTPKAGIKRSAPLNSGEIILYLSELNSNDKINDETLSLLLKSPYIYEDFSIIYTENRT